MLHNPFPFSFGFFERHRHSCLCSSFPKSCTNSGKIAESLRGESERRGTVHSGQPVHAAGMRCIAVAGERDLPGLRAADLMVKDLTAVTVERVRALGQ